MVILGYDIVSILVWSFPVSWRWWFVYLKDFVVILYIQMSVPLSALVLIGAFPVL